MNDADNRVTWTDERVATLRALHAEGVSFGEIGKALGVGRNAAIGKAHRIGLTKSHRRPGAKPRQHNGYTIVRPKRAKRRGNLFDIVEILSPDTHELPTEHVVNPLTLLELAFDSCRWPVDGEGLATLFCGDTAADGCSYCARHYRMSIASNRNFSRAEAEMGRREAARNYRKRKAA
jgi:GcrA cell cycle regulator